MKMAKNYIQEGDVLNFTAGANVSSGQPVLIGKRLGIALSDVASGANGSLAVEGVFTVTKVTADVVGQGELLYWDAAASKLTTTSAGNTLAGYAAAAAGNGVTTVEININR